MNMIKEKNMNIVSLCIPQSIEAFSGRNGLLFNCQRKRLSLLFCISLKIQTSSLQTVVK